MNGMTIRAAFPPHPNPLPKEERGPFVLAFLWGIPQPPNHTQRARLWLFLT
ncbi:hypothetical protein MRY16398_42790 [Phytobacter sp. MRY16-398]|nr:hypothetical protein MRY16398_42790 [Phytobacter sp. MRY16-398]